MIKNTIEFARSKGAKDRKPRQKRNAAMGTAAKVAGTAVAGAAALKNRKAIGGLARKAGQKLNAGAAGMKGGMKSASPGTVANRVGQARQSVRSGVQGTKNKVANKLDGAGSKMQRSGAYQKKDAMTRIPGQTGGFNKAMKDIKSGDKKQKRGQALRNVASRLRGN
jgi:hypothetical protein